MITAITVCVNYADFLAHSLRLNKDIFYDYLVVTSKEDIETQKLCDELKVKYLVSNRVGLDGGFHKGKAINDGLIHLNTKDWVCVIDADTIIERYNFGLELGKQLPLDENCLYGLLGRGIIESKEELAAFLESGTKPNIKSDEYSYGNMIGFFHLWNTKTRPFYPEESNNAGLDDILMRDSFQRKHWRQLNCYGIHLGPLWLNHSGRVTERFV